MHGEDTLLLVLAADPDYGSCRVFAEKAVDPISFGRAKEARNLWPLNLNLRETAYGYIEADIGAPFFSADGSAVGYPVFRFHQSLI